MTEIELDFGSAVEPAGTRRRGAPRPRLVAETTRPSVARAGREALSVGVGVLWRDNPELVAVRTRLQHMGSKVAGSYREAIEGSGIATDLSRELSKVARRIDLSALTRSAWGE